MLSINSIHHKITNCKDCSLCEINNSRIVMKNGNINSKILFFTSPPNFEESKYGETLMGDTGKYFLNILNNYGIQKSDIWCENIIHCKTPTNRSPSEYQLDTCSDFAFQIISTIQPIVIMIMGAITTNIILGKWYRTPIYKLVGKFIKLHFGSDGKKLIYYNIIPNWSPAHAMRNKGKIAEEFKNNILKACIKAQIGKVI